ncbi:MAG: flagellar export chaperone FliS [Clostridiaceae bacterium]|nr:flagellar export chaperone FliS [Clostridiaceae bacterium]
MPVNEIQNKYMENSINTATHEELTMMLYNGLVKFIMIAQSSLEENSLDKTNNNILRAQAIIREFRVTLDMKYEVSQGLDLIYDYMDRKLIEANVKKDKSILQEVLNYARELRDTWGQAVKLAKTQPLKTSEVAK